MKYIPLILLFISCVCECPPTEIHIVHDTILVDTFNYSRIIRYADSVLEVRRENIKTFHAAAIIEVEEYMANIAAEIERTRMALDSTKRVRGNLLIKGDSAKRIQSIGFDQDNKPQIIWSDE